MATVTPVYTHKSFNRAVVKVVGNASTDTATIALKTNLNSGNPLTTGNLTINGTTNKVTRASGNWTSDGVVANSVVVINGSHFSVLSVDSALDITLANNHVLTSGVLTTPTVTAYTSPFLVTGQVIEGTPTVSIAGCVYSLNASGELTVARNSVNVFKLFGSGAIPQGTGENSTYDIVVTFTTTAGGTVILDLSKTSGWSAINPRGTV